MHKYLRTIGFSEYKRNKEIQSLLNDVQESPDRLETCDLADALFVTMEKEFAPGMGIGIFGEYDENDHFQIEYYYPFFDSSINSANTHCTLSRHADKNAFSVMSEEYRLGISLIFYLKNTAAYLNCVADKIPLNKKLKVHLSAMSSCGRILLPVKKTVRERQHALVMSQKRLDLIESAQKGDSGAMESLALQEMTQYNQAVQRIRNEDLYSIIDTCFMPAGMECDQYTIIGEIEKVEEIQNSMTQESMYSMLLICNDIPFQLLINKKDLYGEPAVGRRFKGDIWLQGQILFPER